MWITFRKLSGALLLIGLVSVVANADPSVVRVVGNAQSGFHLTRDGKDYFIKGAGGSGSKKLLADYGGNSFRTWGSDTVASDLDEAQKYGLTVTEGMWLGHADQGFDWNNPDSIAKQRQMVTTAVIAGRDKPGLLIWALGNEMEDGTDGADPVVWQEIENLARIVKKLDPNHPVMTVVAETNAAKVAAINRYCPDIDIVGINSYGGGSSVGARYLTDGGVKPYVVTEFGPAGIWELPKNAWGVAAEPTSTQKEDAYRSAYLGSIKDKPMCLGSYAFTWGDKVEATPTWFGMLLHDGSITGVVDEMSQLWTGKAPNRLAPVIGDLELQEATQTTEGQDVHATLSVSDPQSEALSAQWSFLPDNQVDDSAAHLSEDQLSGVVLAESTSGADLKMPDVPGAYRVYVTVHDAHGAAAVGNIPVYVNGSVSDNPDARLVSNSAYRTPKAVLPLVIYANGTMSDTFAASGYMGNSSSISMDTNASTGGGNESRCLKATYSSPQNWAGVVWQSPANDWGDKPGGLNMTGAKELTFKARGENGGETVTFKFGLLGLDKTFHDSDSGELDNVTLTKQWKSYSIDLTGKNLSDIKTPYCWVVAGSGKPISFYLNDVEYR